MPGTPAGPPGDPTDAARRVAPVVRLAPAKLNLTLAVVARRPDGFHELHSVMVLLGLADRLSVAPAQAAPDTIHVTGFDAGPDADNLALRAIAAAREAVGAGWSGPAGPPPPLAARLDKRIPVAAGLAGGSSDAVAALDAALEAWGASLTVHERLRIAARLGSDLPFFLAGGAALVEGRGETVTPLRGIVGDAPGVLLLTPRLALPTATVFAAFDAVRAARAAGTGGSAAGGGAGATRATSAHLADELRAGLTARALMDRAGILAVANDLAPAAALVVPELTVLRRGLGRLIGRPVGLSGSGPTLWVLYPSADEAAVAAEAVRAAIAAGRLTVPGAGEPFITATTITSRPATDRSEP